MSYNKTFNNLLVRRRIRILTKSLRMVHIPYSIGTMKVSLSKRMRFVLNLQMTEGIFLRMRFILNSLFLNMQLVYTF